MSTTSPSSSACNDNPDPVTGEAGAHPVATGVGAAAIGAAGLAAAVTVAGPVGIAAAIIGGSTIGGYVGKAVGELVDPTAEEAFWRQQHPQQPYAQPRVHDNDYFTAYRVGYVGYPLFNGHERSFEEAEAELRAEYEGAGAKLPWDRARVATRAAWDRVHSFVPRTEATSEAQHAVHESFISENLQSGALSNAQMPR